MKESREVKKSPDEEKEKKLDITKRKLEYFLLALKLVRKKEEETMAKFTRKCYSNEFGNFTHPSQTIMEDEKYFEQTHMEADERAR